MKTRNASQYSILNFINKSVKTRTLFAQRAFFFVVVMLVCSVGAFGQTTYTWNGGNGAWNVAGNWTPATVPPSSNTNTIVEFSDGGTYTITSVPSTIVRQLFVLNNGIIKSVEI